MSEPRPLPVTILTGFLGAGKTTLLRALLAERGGLRIGVIMNEIGLAGVEAAFQKQKSYVEISGGCVCCIVNRDLHTAIAEMHARGDLDRVIVETTGLADPGMIVWNLKPDVDAGRVRLDAVTAVVDPTGYADAGAEWQAQVRVADLIVLSKEDVAARDAVEGCVAAVRVINDQARILHGYGEDTLDVVIDTPRAASPQLELFAAPQHSDFAVVSFANRAVYRLSALKECLGALPAAVFRAKGVVRVDTGLWAIFHVVAGRVSVDFDVAAPEHGENRVVLMGRGLDETAITRLFARCVTNFSDTL